MTAPLPGESWRLTTTVQVADFGVLPPGSDAVHIGDDRRHPYVFPLRAGLWRPADTPTAEVALEQRIHLWERAAANAPRNSIEQHRARAVVEELVTFRALITRGTLQ